MARDYGTRRAARKKSSGPQQFLVVIISFVIGYLSANLFDAQKLSHWLSNEVLASHQESQEAPKVVQKKPELPPKPKFEFYTLLANEKAGAAGNRAQPAKVTAAQVPTTPQAPKSTAQVVANSAAASVKTNTNAIPRTAPVKVAVAKPVPPAPQRGSAYLVQVAAFKARPDAEHMKGLLTLKGFSVSVVPVSNAKGNWFRVVTGPYANKEQALRAQATLARNERLRGMITPIRG